MPANRVSNLVVRPVQQHPKDNTQTGKQRGCTDCTCARCATQPQAERPSGLVHQVFTRNRPELANKAARAFTKAQSMLMASTKTTHASSTHHQIADRLHGGNGRRICADAGFSLGDADDPPEQLQPGPSLLSHDSTRRWCRSALDPPLRILRKGHPLSKLQPSLTKT